MKTKIRFSKQILSILLCLAMLMSYVPMTAYAAEPIILSGNTFTTDPGEGFTFRAMYYCGKCKTYSYINNPGAENHSLEITSFNYTISQGKISYSYGYKVNGCEGEATGSFSKKTYTFDCSSDQYKYNTGYSITPTGLSTSQSVSVKFRRDISAHQGNATCATADNCVLCGTSYKDASNHEKTNEFTYSVNSDPAKHDVKYACCGATKETVAHSLQYSHNGNTITETCSINCGHSATATLAIENGSYAYTGTAITPAAITYTDNWQGEKPTDISYSNNINASTEGNPATATITVNGYELSDTFQITQAIITDENVVLNPESGTYTGTAYEPKISVVWNGATLVEDTHYKVSWDKTGYETPATYTARVVGIGNFDGYVDKTFTINAADLSDVEVKPTATLTYDGTAQTPTVSANAVAVNNQPITFAYSTEENGTYGNLPSFTNAGTYTVYYKASAPNHEMAKGRFTVTVNKAVVTEPTIAGKPYTGEAQTADIVDTDLYTVEQNNGGTARGSYDVVLRLIDSANYKWSTADTEEITLQFEISAAENTWITEPSMEGWTYGKAANAPEYAAKYGTVEVVYTGTANDGTSYRSETAPTEAGNYTVTFTVEATENYSGLSASVDFTVAKAVFTVSAPSANELTYNGTAQELITAGTTDGGTMVYSLDGENYYEEIPTATNAGEYTVYYKVIGDKNHFDTEPSERTVTIARKSVTVSATVPDRIYGDNYMADTSKVVVTFDGIIYGDDVGYVVTEATYYMHTVTDNAPVQVIYNVNGEDADNYKFPEYGDWVAPNYPVEAVGKVLPRDIAEAEIVLGDALTYNGTEQTQSIASVTVIGKDVTYTVSGNTATNVGVYELTITGNGNFTGTKTALYEIAVDMNGVDFDQLHPLNVKATDKEKIEYIYNQLNNASRDYADAEKCNEWDNDKSYCVELLKMIESVASHIESFKNKLAEYDINTVTSDDYADLESFYNDEVAYLYDNYFDNLTEEQAKELDNILSDISALQKRISDVANEIARINEAVNGYDTETVTSADIQDLGKLIEDIKALTEGDNLTEDERAALEANDAAVDGLVEKLTEVAEEIKRADEAVKSYDEDTVKSTDSEDLANLKEDVQALIDSTNTSESEKTALEEMLKDIEGLKNKVAETEQQLEEIADTESSYNPDSVSSDDKAAIEEKLAEIEAVNPDNLTEEQKAEYEEIKAGFEALLEEIEKAGAEVDAIGAEVEMFDEERVTIFWEDDIEALKAKIDGLLADENMGETEKAKLEEYQAQCDKLIEIINTPKEYFSLRFFYFIRDCLCWKHNGLVSIFKNLFGC